MSRGSPEHISESARQIVSSEAHRAVQERMEKVMRARLRSVDPTDAEACRVIVIQIQEHEAYFNALAQMVREGETRERRATVEVV